MDQYLIVAQSITQAQHMQRALRRSGVYGQIVRGHRAITPNGCGYTLQLFGMQLDEAIRILRGEGFAPFRVYRLSRGRYEEVAV